MIFSCGLTFEEQARRRAEWHDFFALWPRTVEIVDGRKRCAWLQTIERRSRYVCGLGEVLWINEYRKKETT